MVKRKAPPSSDVDDVYKKNFFVGGLYQWKNVSQYEMDQYFEKTLWPSYAGENSKSHIMSIVVMINEKFRERLPSIWEPMEGAPEHFGALFSHVTRMVLAESNLKEKTALLIFLIHCFNSVESEMIRTQIQKYVAMTLWTSLSKPRLEEELSRIPKLRKLWKKIEKTDATKTEEQLATLTFERTFMKQMIVDYFKILSGISDKSKRAKHTVRDSIQYCERFLEFMIDLEALLPTRRFFNSLIDDLHVVTLSRLSELATTKSQTDGKLFLQLLDNLTFYARFEIEAVSGDALNDKQIALLHLEKIVKLQKAVFKLFPDETSVRPLYIDGVTKIDTRERLSELLGSLSHESLVALALELNLGFETIDTIKSTSKLFPNIDSSRLLVEIIVYRHERVPSQLRSINQMPLYPSEQIIWDENLVPSQMYFGDAVLPLPKLNIQFLTLHDYLLRNYHLFRLESTYEIRQDIEAAVAHMNPWRSEDGTTMFGGWARMALPIDSFVVNQIGKPRIGERQPSRVKADVIVNLNVRRNIAHEWQQLRKHDVCFLVTVQPERPPNSVINFKEPIAPQAGVVYVRGCEIDGMLDPSGKIIDEFNLEYGPHGSQKLVYNTDYRTFRVSLDPNQFYLDSQSMAERPEAAGDEDGSEEVYDSFNIIVRRRPKANNFKAVLETIRDLMNTKFVVPDWLHDVILGYGDPSSAHYKNLKINSEIGYDRKIDFFDTFIDSAHIQDVFSAGKDTQVKFKHEPEPNHSGLFQVEYSEGGDVLVESVTPPYEGLYVNIEKRLNKCRFTPTQVEAIKSGLNHGLTMVVGPPGTGKTDLAVQIINLLYHNHPDQRTLIVTHSNQALNAIFEKIMALNIDQRHLLRLGHGEESLETEQNFSRTGRVDYVLAKRFELLDEVSRIAKALGHSTDVAHTCETAGYFYLYKVVATWEAYLETIHNTKSLDDVSGKFPFLPFFEGKESEIFRKENFDDDFRAAQGCFRYIQKVFTQLEEFKPFEMLRTGYDRSNYLLLREAKIIAMTCTHAALKRKELSKLGFQFDNVLMEESAQILEIETFIPLLLQNSDFGHNRLKRWIMIGDHLQLPPVIQNMSFQKFCNMEQSLFTRFVRLGVPTIYLDAQGRSRDSIAQLWSWRYKNLGSLPHVSQQPEFKQPNPGFLYDYQMINVDDFDGQGESEPMPHFYQNLAEAEFVVATYMFMRLLGYPAKKISLLTTYTGQKHLIRDIVEQRCANNPFIGRPDKITTVDKFQGQQNDYILLSLVRTKAYGHIRDIRRLTVAMSRARLGLYVFCREALFGKCFELQKTFKLLQARPTHLSIVPDEEYSQLIQGKGVDSTQSNLFVRPDNSNVQALKQMPEMLDFVFNFYEKRTKWLEQNQPDEFRRIMSGQQETIGDSAPMAEDPEAAAPKEDAREEGEDVKEAEEEEEGEEMLFEALGDNDVGMADDIISDSEAMDE